MACATAIRAVTLLPRGLGAGRSAVALFISLSFVIRHA